MAHLRFSRLALAAATIAASTFAAPVWAYTVFLPNTASATLTFSDALIGAVQDSGAVVSGSGFVFGDTAVTFNNVTPSLDSANAVTDVAIIAAPITVSTPINFASTGGAVSFGNLSVQIADPSHINVYADVSGSNGLASQAHMLLWTSSGLSAGSDTTVSMANKDSFNFALPDLYLTDAGKAALAQGLGLTATGQSIFGGVGSYGRLNVSMTFSATEWGSGTTPAVPEPSTYALMLVGLGAAAGVAARRRAA